MSSRKTFRNVHSYLFFPILESDSHYDEKTKRHHEKKKSSSKSETFPEKKKKKTHERVLKKKSSDDIDKKCRKILRGLKECDQNIRLREAKEAEEEDERYRMEEEEAEKEDERCRHKASVHAWHVNCSQFESVRSRFLQDHGEEVSPTLGDPTDGADREEEEISIQNDSDDGALSDKDGTLAATQQDGALQDGALATDEEEVEISDATNDGEEEETSDSSSNDSSRLFSSSSEDSSTSLSSPETYASSKSWESSDASENEFDSNNADDSKADPDTNDDTADTVDAAEDLMVELKSPSGSNYNEAVVKLGRKFSSRKPQSGLVTQLRKAWSELVNISGSQRNRSRKGIRGDDRQDHHWHHPIQLISRTPDPLN